MPHDTIGMKPIDRFGIDLARVRFLAPSEHSDELFFAEATRKVKKDNTFSFQSRRYETLVELSDKEIQLRYDRHRPDPDAVVIYYKGQRLGVARLLDAVANGMRRRKGAAMIRSFYGSTQNLFDLRELLLLPHQQEIHDTLKKFITSRAACAWCLAFPAPANRLSSSRCSRLPENQYLVATVARTLHSYPRTRSRSSATPSASTSTIPLSRAVDLIEQAFSINLAPVNR